MLDVSGRVKLTDAIVGGPSWGPVRNWAVFAFSSSLGHQERAEHLCRVDLAEEEVRARLLGGHVVVRRARAGEGGSTLRLEEQLDGGVRRGAMVGDRHVVGNAGVVV